MEYQEFLESKICIHGGSGFDYNGDLHPILKPHERDIILWGIRGGRRAIFANFGLGKTVMQLEIMRVISETFQGRQLVVCPYGVRQEFKNDWKNLLGYQSDLKIVRFSEEVKEEGIYITNYESVRDGRLDVNLFNACTLDEASVLRSFGSKTYQKFLTLFGNITYRFVATATPSPNRYKELIHYAGYLGVMDTGQALTRFFKRDSTKANNLTLNPSMENEFWLWVSSWAIFIQKPSDLGYSDEGYDLPELHVHECMVSTEARIFEEKDGQQKFIPNPNLDLKEAAREKRDSIDIRIDKLSEIIKEKPDDNFIFWHDQEAERHAIKKAIPETVEVYGSQELEVREERVMDFSYGKIKYFASKPILSGSGCNFQRHCNNAIFLGIGFKFNDFIQAIHRIHRFLQKKECHIYLIFTDTEVEIFKTLMEKWNNHKRMVGKMAEIIKKYGLSHVEMANELKRSIGVKRIEERGESYVAVNNDSVLEIKNKKDNSVGFICTSIPFGNHYEYTATYHDFGHNKGNEDFFKQMDFLSPELLRVLEPGRIMAIHTKDRVQFGSVTGYGMPSIDPFHCLCISHYIKHGFIYCGMITVVTDVVRENNQTYRLGWTENGKDGTKMGVGCPEYVLLFRKLPTDTSRAYADNPVVKDKSDYSRARWQIDAHGFERSSGNRAISAEELSNYEPDVVARTYQKYSLENIYDYEHHVKIGEELDLKGKLPSSFMTLAPASWHSDVWTDVCRMRTLNGDQVKEGLNTHICPLQFDIVDRLITRFSNKGDVVLDPFAGLFTVPLRAILKGRRGEGWELNFESFCDGVKYLKAAEVNMSMPDLFGVENIEC
jgi:DNA modification methylase